MRIKEICKSCVHSDECGYIIDADVCDKCIHNSSYGDMYEIGINQSKFIHTYNACMAKISAKYGNELGTAINNSLEFISFDDNKKVLKIGTSKMTFENKTKIFKRFNIIRKTLLEMFGDIDIEFVKENDITL